MIFRFSDNKALTFAYAELLEIGIPESSIVASFEESAPRPQPPAVHASFLEHLHSWFIAAKARQETAGHDEEKTEPPMSPVFRKNGGSLEVKSKDHAAEIVRIAVHHYGEMVA